MAVRLGVGLVTYSPISITRTNALRISLVSVFRSGFLAFALFLATSSTVSAEPAAIKTNMPVVVEGADCSIAQSAIVSASRLRNLKIKRKVPCRLQDRAEVERYLRTTIDKKIPRERVRQEGEVYRLLGLIPADYDYFNGLIDLYTDQLGGYYDPDQEYYAMASWMPMVMQMPIAVHELTHALQDQHFGLDDAIDHEKQVSDSLMARSGLIEGDATAVMLDYSRELSGQPSIAREESISAFMMQNITGAMITASMHKAPTALQALLIFPYVSGLNFAHALLKTDGYNAIDKAFHRYPRSCEEILHPEKYLSAKPDFKDLEVLPPPNSVKRAAVPKPEFTDRLGEFVISTLLGSYIPPKQASIAAAGWGGDAVALYEGDTFNGAQILTWHVAWDTEADALEFISALEIAYRKRFSVEPQRTGNTLVFSGTEVGEVRLERTGQDTQIYVIRNVRKT